MTTELEKFAGTGTPSPGAQPRRRIGMSTVILVALLSATLAASGTYLAVRPRSTRNALAATRAPAKPPARYQCPMHPNIVQDHPGDCPICGMKLVKMDTRMDHQRADDRAAATVPGLAAVDIDPARQQLIGLHTAAASRGPIGGSWRTVGRVAVDETRVRRVNIKVPGYVERIYVNYVGKTVHKGDPLFSIYSPELLVAQDEYLIALRSRKALSGDPDGDGDTLVKAARRRLALWDVPAAAIERLEKTGEPSRLLTFTSPVSGVVTRKDVVEGTKLDAGAMPYEIVDLSTVWVLADVYESELHRVKVGMPASLTLQALPGREFHGKVLFIDPLLDPKTRTAKVRLAFKNRAGELRPEMFGEAVLHTRQREGLRIPEDAVVDSGTEKIVFVALGEGRFQPRTVRLGESDGNQAEVVSGLTEGEQVVTRANFLVDSESRLRASLAELAAAAGPKEQADKSARVLPPSPAAAGSQHRHGAP